MSSASTIPYQLRPNKAIERNLFIEFLKKLQLHPRYEFNKYRYVGFGAPFLEDFKQMHYELDITDMVCLEYNETSYFRQEFNKPFSFIEVQPISSTKYIQEGGIYTEKGCIIWLDFASAKEFGSQLQDLEMLTDHVKDGDVIKFTFNSHPPSYADAFRLSRSGINETRLYHYMQNDGTYSKYLPIMPSLNSVDNNLGGLLRTMGIRAIEKGLADKVSTLSFTPLSAFQYADGQNMTTVTGIVTESTDAEEVMETTRIRNWPFFVDATASSLMGKHKIGVPAMTVAERNEIEKRLPAVNLTNFIDALPFKFDSVAEDNSKLIENYCKYYKYLPYFAKVIY